ncbi:hypothetical protein GALMADRAFT_69973 [Galerina marginata CBS 339.88]|uniref:RING-type domain-containing protein n=1 Tax=Galerina marginata (strain CBS 339.88) TaxID=685588 RepID=A0A067T843_GALM3|nr:hypothetical protein GALMADRAFT_69973 [Galerina marginata CBS 339.88]
MSIYNYVDTPNNNLICCICRAPFTEPTTTRTCAHTFCYECILRALSHSPLCPVDRSPLAPTDLCPANPIVRSLVDELLVECIHQPEGCAYTCQRQVMPLHLRDECEYAEVACGEKEGGEGKEEETEERGESESETYTCTHAGVGCPYKGTLKPAEHLETCPYESLKEFIAANTGRVSLLTEQNVMLRHRVDILEGTVHTQRKEMNVVKNVLGPWFRTSSELPLGMQAGSAGPSSGEGDALAAYFPGRTGVDVESTLDGTLTGLRESVAGLAAGVDAVGRRSEMALANETLRLGEEMMSIRAQMHGLRMQVHGMMMDRNAVEYGRPPNFGVPGSITKL